MRRRLGFGRMLLEAVRQEAVLRGARSIVLEVAADNEAARALYRAQGFAPVGRRRHYYRRPAGDGDALILRLALAASPIVR
jgi:ribosomal-protein-alanine N-acetyltransferase